MTKCIVLGAASKASGVPIEFESVLESDLEFIPTDDHPYSWGTIELIAANYVPDKDLMFAYDGTDRIAGVLYVGRWNDGVV